MTGQQILQSDVLDILFEKRNKAYGAYRLRKSYPLQLLKAIGITTALVLLLLFFGGPSAAKIEIAEPKDSIVLRQLNLPKQNPELPRPKPVQPAAPSKAVKTEVLTAQMTPVEQTKEPMATQDDLSNAAVGSSKTDGPPSPGSLQPPAPPSVGGTGSGEPPVVEKKEPPLPSRQPQFPGGSEAWLKFLGRHLTPPADLDAGEKRSVLVRFAVDEEGTVTNFQVVQSGGEDFDNEVIRVLKRMPRWLPAIQNGKPVAVSFTQPVTFVAQ